jgi:hypothetical protein
MVRPSTGRVQTEFEGKTKPPPRPRRAGAVSEVARTAAEPAPISQPGVMYLQMGNASSSMLSRFLMIGRMSARILEAASMPSCIPELFAYWRGSTHDHGQPRGGSKPGWEKSAP